MTKAKPTPGPWVRHVDGDGFYCGEVRGPVGTDFEEDVVADWVSEANSHLIAAAPDLLEALEAMLSHSDGWDVTQLRKRWGEQVVSEILTARAAIAKAKGEA